MTSLQIQYFLATVRQMSFTKAAAELYITQPSLSKQISTLESELGVELFDRSVKTKLHVTPAGALLRDFLSEARKNLNKYFRPLKMKTEPFLALFELVLSKGWTSSKKSDRSSIIGKKNILR